VEDHEALRELEFLALFGMLDPPREEAREALVACGRAGIRVVMITGDHATTATAIAHDLGIGGAHPVTLAGAQLEAMSDEALAAAVERTDVYARVTPQHKLRIVRALQSRGEIVAVTGDGVNDAAALKAADVGVAMGRSGTDVAKEAAELVITDDNFASVYAAVEEGRFAFQNVRNATFFLISSGVAEVVAVVSSILFGFHPPFVPAQILWLNLVTDSAQGIGLAFEPGDPALLRMPPRPVREGLLSRLLTERLLIAGIWMGVATLALFLWQLDRIDVPLAQAQTVALTTMVLFQVLHVFNARSEHSSLFARSPFKNRFLLGGSLGVLVLHVAAIYLPPTQYVLRLEPPSVPQWLAMVATSLTIVVVVELHKRFRRPRMRA
jgi:Ca2+-transporting ATPase